MAWKEGDRTLAKWSIDGFWYSGTIQKILGDKYQILFDDSDNEIVPAQNIRALQLKVGMKIEARWQGKDEFFPGKIATIKGEAIYIKYDDGDEEWIHIGMFRLLE